MSIIVAHFGILNPKFSIFLDAPGVFEKVRELRAPSVLQY